MGRAFGLPKAFNWDLRYYFPISCSHADPSVQEEVAVILDDLVKKAINDKQATSSESKTVESSGWEKNCSQEDFDVVMKDGGPSSDEEVMY